MYDGTDKFSGFCGNDQVLIEDNAIVTVSMRVLALIDAGVSPSPSFNIVTADR
jgi:hypothetical protein